MAVFSELLTCRRCTNRYSVRVWQHWYMFFTSNGRLAAAYGKVVLMICSLQVA